MKLEGTHLSDAGSARRVFPIPPPSVPVPRSPLPPPGTLRNPSFIPGEYVVELSAGQLSHALAKASKSGFSLFVTPQLEANATSMAKLAKSRRHYSTLAKPKFGSKEGLTVLVVTSSYKPNVFGVVVRCDDAEIRSIHHNATVFCAYAPKLAEKVKIIRLDDPSYIAFKEAAKARESSDLLFVYIGHESTSKEELFMTFEGISYPFFSGFPSSSHLLLAMVLSCNANYVSAITNRQKAVEAVKGPVVMLCTQGETFLGISADSSAPLLEAIMTCVSLIFHSPFLTPKALIVLLSLHLPSLLTCFFSLCESSFT